MLNLMLLPLCILPSLLLSSMTEAQTPKLDDSLAFSLVTDEARKKVGSRNWSVSLEPFEIALPIVIDEDIEQTPLSPEQLHARRTHLKRANIPIGPRVSLKGCVGIFVLDVTPQERKDCPKSDSIAVSVGSVRLDGYGDSAEAHEPLNRSIHRTVRMVIAEFSANGSSVEVFDVTLRWSNEGWKHLKTTSLVIAE